MQHLLLFVRPTNFPHYFMAMLVTALPAIFLLMLMDRIKDLTTIQILITPFFVITVMRWVIVWNYLKSLFERGYLVGGVGLGFLVALGSSQALPNYVNLFKLLLTYG